MKFKSGIIPVLWTSTVGGGEFITVESVSPICLQIGAAVSLYDGPRGLGEPWKEFPVDKAPTVLISRIVWHIEESTGSIIAAEVFGSEFCDAKPEAYAEFLWEDRSTESADKLSQIMWELAHDKV